MCPESRLVDFRRVSHAIAPFCKSKWQTKTDAQLSRAKSRNSPGSSARELSKGSKVSRKPVRDRRTRQPEMAPEPNGLRKARRTNHTGRVNNRIVLRYGWRC